jgi:hypothetical protein
MNILNITSNTHLITLRSVSCGNFIYDATKQLLLVKISVSTYISVVADLSNISHIYDEKDLEKDALYTTDTKITVFTKDKIAAIKEGDLRLS